MRHIPIFTFVNKMDRETRRIPSTFMEEIETGAGHRHISHELAHRLTAARSAACSTATNAQRPRLRRARAAANATKKVAEIEAELGDPGLDELIGCRQPLTNSHGRHRAVSTARPTSSTWTRCAHGKLSPVFFGSALTNFGVEPFLKEFLRLAPAPLPYTDILSPATQSTRRRKDFSGFVFKIQANMDKNHRDRIAFVRICSGKFERGMDAFHVQGGKKLKLAHGHALMADDRATVDEAYAGDIVGLFDPGIFSIGDTVCTGRARAVPAHPHVLRRSISRASRR